jgi:serine protease Do
VKVTLGERPANLGVHAGLGQPPAQGTLRGITVQNLTPELRQQLGVSSGTQGVVISNLDPNSPAAQAGVQQGDVIESVNHQPVRSTADFERLAAEAKGDTLLRINRQGNGIFVVISGSDNGGQGGDSQ